MSPYRYERRQAIGRVARVALAFVLAAFLAAGARAATVSLVIDYGDGAQLLFTSIPWRSGMTVLDSLVYAQAHPHGVKFSQRGSGVGALVTKIGDLANQGGGERDKNWLFSVNGKSSNVGAGSFKLEEGDAVLWKFQVYDYNSR